MKKASLIHLQFAIAMVVAISMISCNSNSSEPKAEIKPDTPVAKAKVETPALTPPISSDVLNNLYVDGSVFTGVHGSDKKITMRFFIDKGALTLHGWINKNNDNKYDTTNRQGDFPVNILGASGVTIGDGTNLGNLVIYNQQIKKIKAAIGNDATAKVQFLVLPLSVTYGQIIYQIDVVTTDPKTAKVLTTTTVGQTNPSPPRATY